LYKDFGIGLGNDGVVKLLSSAITLVTAVTLDSILSSVFEEGAVALPDEGVVLKFLYMHAGQAQMNDNGKVGVDKNG
jgi:hypothetical protein